MDGGRGVQATVAGWAFAGAALGLAVGATAWSSGVAGAMVPCGLAGAALGGLAGAAITRTGGEQVLGRTGARTVRAPWVLWAPVAAAVPSLAWLAVVLTVAGGSVAPMWVVGGLSIAIVYGAVRAHRRDTLARAVARLDGGDAAARGPLAAIEHRGGPRATSARFALAMHDLRTGDLRQAATRLRHVERTGGPTAGPAAAALALTHVLEDRRADAAAAVQRALATGGPAVQDQTDAVRLLLVWRSEGPTEAHALAERLLGDAHAPLLIALVAALRRATGDDTGADALLTAETQTLLAAEGWRERVPELAAP